MSDREKMLNVRVDEQTMLALAERATDTDVTVSQVVRDIIDRGLGIVRTADGSYTIHDADDIVIPTTRRELYRFYEYFSVNDPMIAEMISYVTDAGPDPTIPNEESGRLGEAFIGLGLRNKARDIVRELALKGDAFPHISFSCPTCQGLDLFCDHKDGLVIGLSILDPANVEVVIANGSRHIYTHPSRELSRIVKEQSPKDVYEKIPGEVIEAVNENTPFPMSNLTTMQVTTASSYAAYGTSIIHPFLANLLKKDAALIKGEPRPELSIPILEVAKRRANRLRGLALVAIQRTLDLQADMWSIPRISVQWPDLDIPRTGRWLWMMAKAWRSGDVSDATFAEAIGADAT